MKPNPRKRTRVSAHRSVPWGEALTRGFWMLCLSALVAGFMGGSWFMYERLVHSGVIDIVDVSVFGARRVGDELAGYMQLRTRMPLSAVDAELLARRLEKHPWIKRAAVEKKYPHTLVLRLEERRPVLVHLSDGLYVVDDEGVWVKPWEASDELDLPVVTNVAVDPVTQAVERLRRIGEFVAYWDDATGPVQVGEVSYVAPGEVIVYTTRLGPRLHLPLDPARWPTARRRLERVLHEASRIGIELKAIDLLYPDRAIAQQKT